MTEREENKLFPDSEVFQKERPKNITSTQLEEIMTVSAGNIAIIYSTYSKEEIKEDLLNLYDPTDSGYEFAKKLEEEGNCEYNIDSDFIEALEYTHNAIISKLRTNIKQWVAAHRITPIFTLGTSFKLKKSPSRGFNVGDKVFITRVNKEEAYYCISFDKDKKGGRCVNFEVLEDCVIT